MTIITTTARASALATAGETNNPFVTGAPLSGTYSTGTGTEVQAAANAYTGTTFDQWTATPASGVATWEVDFATAQAPGFVGMAAHNAADVSAQIRVQSSTDGATWSTVAGTITTPADNQAIAWRLSGGTSARYWRLQFDSLTDAISVGVIWFGSEIIMPRRVYQGYTPPLTPTEVDLNTNVSEGAQLLGTSYVERGSVFSVELSNLSPTFLRGATWTAFQNRWNRGEGAFWAWRPTKYGDLFWSWRSGGVIQPTNAGPLDLMGATIQGRVYHG